MFLGGTNLEATCVYSIKVDHYIKIQQTKVQIMSYMCTVPMTITTLLSLFTLKLC